jgi:S-adenosylmethionine hydrolase
MPLQITILSDLGNNSIYPSLLKSQLLAVIPTVKLIDLSHEADPGDIPAGAYILASTTPFFPSGTLHIALFAPFHHPTTRYLFTEIARQYYLLPDNGLISILARELAVPVYICFEYTPTDNLKTLINKLTLWMTQNVGGDTISWLPSGVPVAPVLFRELWEVSADETWMDCRILYIDRYGNIILNLNKERFQELTRDRPYRIEIGRNIMIREISQAYRPVSDEAFALFTPSGYLQIGIPGQSVAQKLNFGNLHHGDLHYQKVRIFLEP